MYMIFKYIRFTIIAVRYAPSSTFKWYKPCYNGSTERVFGKVKPLPTH